MTQNLPSVYCGAKNGTYFFCAKIRWFTCKSRSEDFSSGLKRCEKFTKGETISVPIAHTHFSGKLRQMTLNKYIATPKTFYKWETKPSYWVFVSTVCSCDINQCQFLSCFLYNHKYQRRNTIQNWTFFGVEQFSTDSWFYCGELTTAIKTGVCTILFLFGRIMQYLNAINSTIYKKEWKWSKADISVEEGGLLLYHTGLLSSPLWANTDNFQHGL